VVKVRVNPYQFTAKPVRTKYLVGSVKSISTTKSGYAIVAAEEGAAYVLDQNLSVVSELTNLGCLTSSSSHGDLLAVAGCGSTIHIYNVLEGTWLTLKTEHDMVEAILLTKRGILVCSDLCSFYTFEGKVVWELDTGPVYGNIARYVDLYFIPSAVKPQIIVATDWFMVGRISTKEHPLSVSAYNDTLYVGTESYLRSYKVLYSGAKPELERYYGAPVVSVAARDLRTVAAAVQGGTIDILRGDGEVLASMRTSSEPTALAWLGKRLLVGFQDGTIMQVEVKRRSSSNSNRRK